MKCPMTFNSLYADVDEECRADCAWLVRYGDLSCCAVAKMACEKMDSHYWMPKNFGSEKGGDAS